MDVLNFEPICHQYLCNGFESHLGLCESFSSGNILVFEAKLMTFFLLLKVYKQTKIKKWI